MQGAKFPGLGPLLAIIDEDVRFAHQLRASLQEAQYRCLLFASYVARDLDLTPLGIQAIILDLATPELDRLAAIRGIRSASDVPILVVTTNGDERDKVDALDAGADDYLSKPLAAREFLARVRVALRHSLSRHGPRGGRIRTGALNVDLLNREVSLHGARLALTPTDYKLLALLARNLGRVVPHEQLLHEAWGPNARDPHYLRVYMARLRRKLDPARAGARYIVTEAGVGYRLLAEPKAG